METATPGIITPKNILEVPDITMLAPYGAASKGDYSHILYCGGDNAGTIVDLCHYYKKIDTEFTPLPFTLSVPRAYMGSVMHETKMYIVGGLTTGIYEKELI